MFFFHLEWGFYMQFKKKNIHSLWQTTFTTWKLLSAFIILKEFSVKFLLRKEAGKSDLSFSLCSLHRPAAFTISVQFVRALNCMK